MPDLTSLTERLREGRNMSDSDVADAVKLLTSPEDTAEAKAELLAALTAKGETHDELTAFARELRQLSVPVPVDEATRAGVILDVCGTGGDRLNTFNISTAVALLCAAAGITVAKHGNRAITSMAGSAEALDALGIPIELTPQQAADSLREHNFAFFFAIKYHPAFQHIGPARKLCAERGQRTIFNIMGPLLNPARPNVQLVGVPRPQFCEPVAKVLQHLGVNRGMVVSGQAGDAFLDEISTIGPSTVCEFHSRSEPASGSIAPGELGIGYASIDDLRGGDKFANARIIRSILEGAERGPKRDAVLINAAAAFWLAGKADSVKEGLAAAAATIDSGAAAAKLNSLARV